MLAKREIDWREYGRPEEITEPQRIPEPKLNTTMRRHCLALAVVLTLFAAVMTARSDTLNQTGSDLVNLKEKESAMICSNENLQVEIAQLQSLERIKGIATQQLGMKQPTAQWYVKAAVSPEKSGSPSTNAVALKVR